MADQSESELVKRLRPCPFCGHDAEFERTGTPRQSCIVACQFCGCRLETGEEGDACGREWNTRAEQDIEALVKALYEMRNAASYERVFTSLPPHLTKRIKESGR